MSEHRTIEWIWRGVGLLALPALGWIFTLSSDLTRAEIERAELLRRIENAEESLRESDGTLKEIEGLLKELTVSARYMARDLEELKKAKQ